MYKFSTHWGSIFFQEIFLNPLHLTKVKSLRGGGKLPINRYKYLSAEVDAPEQRGLNENNNRLLRRDGLRTDMDFRYLRDDFVAAIANKRNCISRKSLNYRTPIEAFMKYLTKDASINF